MRRLKKAMCILLAAGMLLNTGAVCETASAANKAKLSTKKLSMVVGQKKTIKIKNKVKKAKYTFASSKKKVVTVNKKGVVKAVKKGNAKITVKEKLKKSRVVGVVKVAVKENVVEQPTVAPTVVPTTAPTVVPTVAPTPVVTPTAEPTKEPTAEPSPDVYSKELFAVTVEDKAEYWVDGNTCAVTMQYFNGSADGEFFSGNVLSESSFTEKLYKDGISQYSARFVLNGKDDTDTACKIFIQDEWEVDTEGVATYYTRLVTNSPSLAWLETADIQSRVVENEDGSKTIKFMWNESNEEPVPPLDVYPVDTSKSYTKEVFTFNIDIGATDEVNGSTCNTSMIHFGGKSDCANFKGNIVGNCADTRIQYAGQTQTLSARYILEGTRSTGEPMKVYVENNGIDKNGTMTTQPTIITDNPELAWIESAPLHGTVSWSSGLTIHMWTTAE